MKPLIIIGIIFAIFFLISLIPIQCKLSYLSDNLSLSVGSGKLRFTLLPKKEKPQKKDKPKKEQPKKESSKLPGNKLELVQTLLPIVVDGAARLQRKLTIDKLVIFFLMGGSDPANIAIGYGMANGVLGGLIALLERGFHIKMRDIRTNLDFNRTTPLVEVNLQLSLTIGQGVALGAIVGWRVFRALHQMKKSAST